MGGPQNPAGVMSKGSRFEKLEHERAPAAKSLSNDSMPRFEEAETSNPSASLQGDDPALKRFEQDGGEGVRFDTGALADLPMLRCPACNRDSSKWDKHCIYCTV